MMDAMQEEMQADTYAIVRKEPGGVSIDTYGNAGGHTYRYGISTYA